MFNGRCLLRVDVVCVLPVLLSVYCCMVVCAACLWFVGVSLSCDACCVLVVV